MKVTRRYNQSRRDLSIDLECQDCGAIDKCDTAYDDTNYWVNVVPNMKCKKCGKSSIDLNLSPKDISTKYPAHEVV